MSTATAEKPTAIARTPEIAPPTAPVAETAALLSMIERAARDETVNIDKMRELLAMRKEIVADAAEQNFNEAMARAQSEMRPVAADAKNPQTKSKYASYYALDNAVRPIYTKHGFALSFNTESGAPTDYIRVVCYVTCSGHTRKYQIDMPADGKGAKGGDVMTRTHATGSAQTYGQRYLLKAIFNLAVGGDDDGNAATTQRKEQIGDDEAETLRDVIRTLVAETKMPMDKFLIWAKADSIADIPGTDLKDVVASLEQRKRKMGAKS